MIDWLKSLSAGQLVLLALVAFLVVTLVSAVLTWFLVRRGLRTPFAIRRINRLRQWFVNLIKRPITVAVLDEVVKVLETGNYPENLAKSLGAHKDELRSIIAEKIAADPQLGKLKRPPFHDEIVRTVVDTSFRVLLEVLVDPRIDDFFSAVVRENREQIRLAVQLGLNEVDDEDGEKALPVRTQRAAAHEYDRLHPGSRP